MTDEPFFDASQKARGHARKPTAHSMAGDHQLIELAKTEALEAIADRLSAPELGLRKPSRSMGWFRTEFDKKGWRN
jgi:hypothetical protein